MVIEATPQAAAGEEDEMATRAPLPRMTLALRCEECGVEVEAFDANVQRLASEVSRARRDHARLQHGWQPAFAAPAAEATPDAR